MRSSNIWVWFIFIVSVFLFGYIVFNFVFTERIDGPECIEVNRASGFLYDVCYDSLSGNILMLVEGDMLYDFDSFDVVFFDSKMRSYNLVYEDVDIGQLYKFGAEKNPDYINLTLNVVEDFDFPVCQEPRRVLVKDCLTKNPGWGKGSVNGTVIENDVLSVEPERYNTNSSLGDAKIDIWKSFCEPNWECGEWEECIDGYQYRDCVDLNGCYVALDVPNMVRVCGEVCVESWVCEWEDCINGFASYDCYDKNECGTSYNFPPRVRCSFNEDCLPQIVCDSWSECDFKYDLFDLLDKGVDGIIGVKSRICHDLNGCVESIRDVRNCTVGVDIYTEKFLECGEQYLGIYNSLNGDMIARIDNRLNKSSGFDVYLDPLNESKNIICKHCSNGILDADESGVDCGGSCESCVENVIDIDLRSSLWGRILSFFD